MISDLAMAIAKKLYPCGPSTYCYDSEERNNYARHRDWQAIAAKIDTVINENLTDTISCHSCGCAVHREDFNRT